jgi:hypothetical protein
MNSSLEEFRNRIKNLNKQHRIVWRVESPKLVGETLESITEKYQQDNNLNNVPLERWDMLAYSFLSYHCHLMNSISLSQAVCMQKQAAIDLILNTKE